MTVSPWESPPAAQLEPVRDPDSWTAVLTSVADLAQKIAGTPFVPTGLRGNVAAVAACILYGRELGLGPMTALRHVDVIDGRPAPNAELQRALVMQQGHSIVITENTTTRCVIKGRRRGEQDWSTVSWSMDDAKRAGLDGKGNWKKHPADMLVARASSRLCRTVFADAVLGMPVTQEELVDGDFAETAAPAPTEPVIAETAAAPKRTARRATPAPAAKTTSTAPAAFAEPDFEAEPDPPPAAAAAKVDALPNPDTESVTDQQLKKLGVMFRRADLSERETRLGYVTDLIGREITSSKELTKAEASTVIDELTKELDGDATEQDELLEPSTG